MPYLDVPSINLCVSSLSLSRAHRPELAADEPHTSVVVDPRRWPAR